MSGCAAVGVGAVPLLYGPAGYGGPVGSPVPVEGNPGSAGVPPGSSSGDVGVDIVSGIVGVGTSGTAGLGGRAAPGSGIGVGCVSGVTLGCVAGISGSVGVGSGGTPGGDIGGASGGVPVPIGGVTGSIEVALANGAAMSLLIGPRAVPIEGSVEGEVAGTAGVGGAVSVGCCGSSNLS